VQAQTRGGAHFHQANRPVDVEGGEQRRATRGFVGLGPAGQHRRAHPVAVVPDQLAQLVRPGGDAVQEGDGGEEQVRLPLVGRQRQQDVEEAVVLRHGCGERRVQR
jgi:hypothetical protein